MKRNWTVEEGPLGRRMTMNGPWSTEASAEAQSSGVCDLQLNQAKGWRGEDYSFLESLSGQLQSLCIIDFAAKDVSAVNSLHMLRNLSLVTRCKTEIQFSGLPELENCGLEWRPGARSVFEHSGLKSLFINKWLGEEDLASFFGMPQLESLRLKGPSRLRVLTGLGSNSRLKELEVGRATKLASLAGIEVLTGLHRLEVHTCSKVKSIVPVETLTSLRELFICNCGEIETIKPIGQLLRLEKFIFYESTNIVDGDLDVLLTLPELKSVAFRERAHYSLSRKDLAPLR